MSRIDLAPAADDGDAGAGELHQIGGNVECLLGPAMDAADAAGGEDFDSRQLRHEHCRGDRRSRRALARRDQGQIAPRGLDDAAGELAEALDLAVVEADLQRAVDNCDRRRNRAHRPHRLLDRARGFDILRIGHAMGDDGRFQSDQRLAARARAFDLRREIHQIGGAHR